MYRWISSRYCHQEKKPLGQTQKPESYLPKEASMAGYAYLKGTPLIFQNSIHHLSKGTIIRWTIELLIIVISRRAIMKEIEHDPQNGQGNAQLIATSNQSIFTIRNNLLPAKRSCLIPQNKRQLQIQFMELIKSMTEK